MKLFFLAAEIKQKSSCYICLGAPGMRRQFGEKIIPQPTQKVKRFCVKTM